MKKVAQLMTMNPQSLIWTHTIRQGNQFRMIKVNMNINQLYCREVKGKEEIVKLLANLDETNKKVMTSTLYKPNRSGIYVINRSKLKDYRDVTCDSLGSYVNSSSSGSTYDENFELVKEAQRHYILKTTYYTHKTYKCI